MDLFPYEPARNLLPQPLARLTWKLRPMCESAIMADTTMDIHIGTQVITTIAEDLPPQVLSLRPLVLLLKR
jgi:hypothetical protein